MSTAALGTPEYGHYMLWQGICFLWGPGGSFATGTVPNIDSSNKSGYYYTESNSNSQKDSECVSLVAITTTGYHSANFIYLFISSLHHFHVMSKYLADQKYITPKLKKGPHLSDHCVSVKHPGTSGTSHHSQ